MSFCAICYSDGKECCRFREVVVTDGDIERIQNHSSKTDFYENRVPKEARHLEVDDEDPNWVLYTVNEDKTRRILKNRPDGNCILLGEDGCTLPLDVRPLICRLHPYYFSENEMLCIDEDCPIAFFEKPANILERMGMGYEKAEEWRKQLYKELREQYEKKRKKA